MQTDTDAPQQLQQAVASLLGGLSTDQLELTRVKEGLSHANFLCRTGTDRYFVKVYRLGPQPGTRVTEINRITASMRERNIPAPELLAYSSAFPNVVIHRFVDASHVSWDPELIKPVATLYSDIAGLALEDQQFVAKEIFLQDLRALSGLIARQVHEQIGVSQEANRRMLRVCRKVVSELSEQLPDRPLLVVRLHDDFTENNILAAEGEIKLICDWDSYRATLYWENLACSAARFSSAAPRQGELLRQRLEALILALSPQVIAQLVDVETFASVFPFLATLRHLRTYTLRNQRVATDRKDLRESLLDNPLDHCEWLLDQHTKISGWLTEILQECRAQGNSD